MEVGPITVGLDITPTNRSSAWRLPDKLLVTCSVSLKPSIQNHEKIEKMYISTKYFISMH
jgi:hypothetical protein